MYGLNEKNKTKWFIISKYEVGGRNVTSFVQYDGSKGVGVFVPNKA